MRMRPWGWLAVALLAVGASVLPAVAVSETAPSIEAVNKETHHYWAPTAVTIAPGGTVALSNPTAVPHGVHWVGGPATPECSGVPVGTGIESSATGWNGTCTFSAAGIYTFYCTVHGSEMTARVTVASPTTTGSTETQPTTTTTTATTTLPAPPGGSPGPGPGGVLPSPLASGAIRVLAGAHGRSVHGSLSIASTGSGGGLEVDLLARRALVARTPATVLVGQLRRSPLHAGTVHFTVPLNGRGVRALHRHRHLGVTVRLVLTAPAARTVTALRTITLTG